ncbi:hypothetical protein F3Y22_tig00110584pilonHSYRG00095 [Hibiscus syriacus]|uniref:Endonuclease/exonuclease/phosphatase domain-containing protein n=1 Tax=Hibiscus syriacus TaxID=106335 RepID=A0A6A3A7N6_HIBSY|nr:hypothetical protein F3Y22_tig00110584pilonHSYRG00095 [Hibiscus syriacus]
MLEVGSPEFRCYFREHCRNSGPKIVALFETRISGRAAAKIVRRLGFRNSFRVEAHGFSCGIWILWEDEVFVEFLSISNQLIHGRFKQANDSRWLFFTAVYASPQIDKRKHLWRRLMELDLGDKNAWPWILGGDFNSILRPDKRSGG